MVWTMKTTTQFYSPMLEDKILEDAAKEIQKEIDWQVLKDLLVETGWVKVELTSKWLPCTGIELDDWRKKNLTGRWYANDNIWIFEKAEDAVLFTLRWQ